MSFGRTRVHLFNAHQGHGALMAIWTTIKPYLIAGHRLVVTVEPEKRSLPQNDKFHAMCEDFARSGVEWMNKRRTKDQWKVLLVSGHAIATKEGAEVVPGLEGEFVNIRESTASMSKARGSSLIEYTLAAGVRMGVKFRDQEVTA
jgi:hypothetical protein